MSFAESNPYHPPQLNSFEQDDPAANSENVLQGLKPRSLWLMFFLTLITFGFYMNYWVHRTATVLNRNLDTNRISMALVGLFWFSSAISLSWIIPEIVSEDDPTIVRVGDILTRAGMIIALVVTFAVRGAINRVTQVPRGHHAWVHGFWTFLFGYLYLQWKINRNLRIVQLPLVPSTTENKPSFEQLAEKESTANQSST